jgi:hypothetical protein
MSSVSLNQTFSTQSISTLPLSLPSPIKKLLPDILRLIQNFIEHREIVQTVHLVNREWSMLLPNDGFLELQTTHITGHHLANIIEAYVKKASLRSLDLSECSQIKDDDLRYLGEFSARRLHLYTQDGRPDNFNLNTLWLNKCKKITARSLQYLSRLPLFKLDLQESIVITNKGLQYLSKCSSLKHLNLNYCGHLLTDKSLTHLSKLDALEELHLAGQYKITNQGLLNLSKLSFLKYLDLSKNKSISDEGLAHLKSLPLERLDLDECPITDKGLKFLADFLHLKHLHLRGLKKISSEGLKSLSSLPLETLNLMGFKNLKSEDFEHLAKLPLTRLDLDECDITAPVIKILSRLPLKELHVDECAYACCEGERYNELLDQFPKIEGIITYHERE